MHAVMKHWDPMLGCDFHMGTIPPAPPAGPFPYFTMQLTSGLYIFFKPIWDQVTLYGVSVEKGTDIGSGIPHVGTPVVELPAMIAFSASKSHFYSATYFVKNKNPALALAVFANPNLNCGLPVPTPTGVAVCINTHVAGMSWADILGGFGSMYGDIVVQTLFNVLGMKYGNAFGGWVAGRVGASGGGFIASQAWNIMAFMMGSPLGGSSTNLGGVIVDQKGDAWNPGGAFGNAVSSFTEGVGRAMGDVLEGNPPQMPVPDIRYPAGLSAPVVSNVTTNAPPH
jgi:hypothetical protein